MARDEFTSATRTALALRAGYRCSLCDTPTVGPSDEAVDASASIGVAAHICAASAGPGSRRYRPSMSAEERSSITNGIWLCANHAQLIDRDEATYTPIYLEGLKERHEEKCAAAIDPNRALSHLNGGLVAIGPDVICTGYMDGGTSSSWVLSINHFVLGDINALLRYIEEFPKHDTCDQFVIVNELGDGRALQAAPSWTRTQGGYQLTLAVQPSFPRITGQSMPTDVAFDFRIENGDIATVSGLNAIDQKIRLCMSHQRGESPFSPTFGVRIGEFYHVFRQTTWLNEILKLELIRLAAIPYFDSTFATAYTPLHCIERVWSITPTADAPRGKWLPVAFEVEVRGYGRWTSNAEIHIPDEGAVVRAVDRMGIDFRNIHVRPKPPG